MIYNNKYYIIKLTTKRSVIGIVMIPLSVSTDRQSQVPFKKGARLWARKDTVVMIVRASVSCVLVFILREIVQEKQL